MTDLPTFSTLLPELHCVLYSLIDIIEPSTIREYAFPFCAVLASGHHGVTKNLVLQLSQLGTSCEIS